MVEQTKLELPLNWLSVSFQCIVDSFCQDLRWLQVLDNYHFSKIEPEELSLLGVRADHLPSLIHRAISVFSYCFVDFCRQTHWIREIFRKFTIQKLQRKHFRSLINEANVIRISQWINHELLYACDIFFVCNLNPFEVVYVFLLIR